MKPQHWILVVSVSIGVAATGALWYAQRISAELVPVLVAAHDVEARQVIQKEDLTYQMVPPSTKDEKAIQDPAQLVGQLLLSPVFAGEQIRPGRVNSTERELAPDELAIGFLTDLTKSVGGLLESGDVVDLFWAPERGGNRVGRVEVYKVGEGYRVLSVRDNTGKATGPRVQAELAKSGAAAGLPNVVVLKVPNSQVAALRQAAEVGQITFAKRSPNAPVPNEPVLTPLPAAAMSLDVNGLPQVLVNPQGAAQTPNGSAGPQSTTTVPVPKGGSR